MVSIRAFRLVTFLAVAGASTIAVAQLTKVPILKTTPIIPPAAIKALNPIEYADLPIVVGATGGYLVQVPGMTTDGLNVLGSGYKIGNTTTGVAVTQSPNGAIVALIPGNMPAERMILPEPHWMSVGSRATSITADKDALYGVDSQAGQIWRYDYATKEVRTFGSKGDGPGQFSLAEKIAVDAQGRIYVSDHNRIVRIDDISGTGWATFGKFGGGRGQFNYITGLAVDSKARIYAVDHFNGRLVKIDNMLGDGWEEMRFEEPNCVATDARDRIYVCESSWSKLTRINNMSGAGRKVLWFPRSNDWKYGSFGNVAILKPVARDNDVIR